MKAQWIKSFFYSVMIILFMVTIVGCHRVSAFDENPIIDNLSSEEQTLLAEIKESDIQVIQQGMMFIFVIPTDCFFTKDTRELKRHRLTDIDRLALFLRYYMNRFRDPRVTITGHTDKVWISQARDRLSLHYAETIADFLRQDDVSADRIFVFGAGAKDPVAANGYPLGASFNRRVVVVVD